MPGFSSDHSGGKQLDATTLRGTGTSYLALILSTPAHDSTLASITELALSGYSRQAVTWTTPAFDTNSGAMLTSNSNVIDFGPFSADMTSVSAWAILVDAASGTTGNILYCFQLDLSLEATAGTPIQFDAGTLNIYSS
jgi:hypothetical protein